MSANGRPAPRASTLGELALALAGLMRQRGLPVTTPVRLRVGGCTGLPYQATFDVASGVLELADLEAPRECAGVPAAAPCIGCAEGLAAEAAHTCRRPVHCAGCATGLGL